MQTVNELKAVMGGDVIWVVLACMLGACVVIATIGKAVEVVKSWRRSARERSGDVMTCLHNDKHRLDDHEARLKRLEDGLTDEQEGQRALMQGVMALLDHELHNGNADQMEHARDGINNYLISK